MPHVDKQAQDQIEVMIRWTRYMNLTAGEVFAYGLCVFGDYIAVVGVASDRPYVARPYVALLRKSDGVVVKEWTGGEWEVFRNCISVGGKLYAIGSTSANNSYGVIYVFDENLNVLAKVRSESSSEYYSLAYDGKALYIGGWAGWKGWVWLVEKRALDGNLSLVSSKKIHFGPWIEGRIYDIGVEPSTGRIWAVGWYRDSNYTLHSLIVMLDGDLRVLKVIDYPRGSEGYLGELYGIAFDGRQYAYIVGDDGIAKFNADGRLEAIKRDFKARGKIVYYNGYLYTFGVDHIVDHIRGYYRHVLDIFDINLNLAKRYVLGENVHSDLFDTGMLVLEGDNIYVAGHVKALGRSTRVVMYSLLLRGGGGREHGKPAVITRGGEETPREFRGYRLLEPVGRGGFADVYKALDRNGNVVALKIYRSSDKAFVEEIGNIVQLTKKLELPYVVRVLDYGVEPRPFIVMEFYPMSLRRLMKRRGEVDFDKLLKLMIRVARALKYAHSVGVFHGDLKPENILVYEEGGEYYPAVADWGGGVTPGYSAPEVYESGGRVLSGKSDVWSFGAILYEVLKGEKLFKDPLEYDAYVRSGRDLSIDLANPLEDIIERCLARDPAERPTIDEVIAELEEQLVETVSTIILTKSRGKPGLEPKDIIHLINTYIYTGRLKEAEEKLKYAESSGSLKDKDVVLIYMKIIELYDLFIRHSLSRSGIPCSEVERLYNAILEVADKDLRKKLEEARCSLRDLLKVVGDFILPEHYGFFHTCLGYINDIVTIHYLSK